jgi:hypothetical protein
VALAVDPRMIVVGDEREIEADHLGTLSIAN